MEYKPNHAPRTKYHMNHQNLNSFQLTETISLQSIVNGRSKSLKKSIPHMKKGRHVPLKCKSQAKKV